jgi:predicted nucleic acid-binding protein
MTVLLDTNVIMDVLQERQPFIDDALQILELGREGKIECLFTANAASNIFFLYSKARDLQSARTALNFFLATYGVVSVTQEDCINAMSVGIDDFEDALVAVCAKKAGADYIVTRDNAFLKEKSPVPLIKAGELLEILN